MSAGDRIGDQPLSGNVIRGRMSRGCNTRIDIVDGDMTNRLKHSNFLLFVASSLIVRETGG